MDIILTLDQGDIANVNYWKSSVPGATRDGIIRGAMEYALLRVWMVAERHGQEMAKSCIWGPWTIGARIPEDLRKLGPEELKLRIPDRLESLLITKGAALFAPIKVSSKLLNNLANAFTFYGVHQMHDDRLEDVLEFFRRHFLREAKIS